MTHLPFSRFIQVRGAYGGTYSHDGESMFFLTAITGMPQVWRQKKTVPWPQQITFFEDRIMGVSASPAEPLLCMMADEGGSERAQLYLLDFDGVNVQRITDDSDSIHQFGGFSPDGSRIAYSSNKRNGRDFDIYTYDIRENEHRLVHESAYTNHVVGFSPAGDSLLITRHYTNLNNDLFLLNLSTGDLRLLTPHEGEVQYDFARFDEEGQNLFLACDKDGEFSRLARLSLGTLALEFLTEDDWDCDGVVIAREANLLAYRRNEGGQSRVYLGRIGGNGSIKSMDVRSGLPSGVIAGMSWSKAGDRLALAVSSPAHGTDIWELTPGDAPGTGELRRVTYAAISSVPEDLYVEPELVEYSSFDGLTIPAYYYKPKGAGPYAVVVYVHGGPESQSRNMHNPIIQYFVHHGYAVFVPNVRGSAGYGRTYVHLDDVRKRMDSVSDLAACVDWLVSEGNARRDAIGVMGGSYGGFMVLAAVTHHPDLWAAGVDIVGIANLRTFMDNTSAYRRHLRESEYGSVEKDGEFFDEISPIHHVDKIKAPMMIIHGANDPRVPVGEAEQMVEALRARNHPVTYLRFEDEGHGVVKLPNRIKAYGAIAEFLDEHMPPQ